MPPASAGPKPLYEFLVASGQLRHDEHQRLNVGKLQALFEELKDYSPPKLPAPIAEKRRAMEQTGGDAGRDRIKSPDFAWVDDEKTIFGMITDLFKPKIQKVPKVFGPNGMYLYGDVGTGKTMLMDLFYESIQTNRKRRIHFHEFMQDVHKRIHRLRTHEGITSDPIPLIAAELASDAWLLCFDEFQVTDIADAMILRRLLSALLERGVVLFTTSNRHPDDLYQNGIQRASFLPAIALLKERCSIVSLNSGIDYRKIGNKLPTILVATRELYLWGRKFVVKDAAGRVAKISFNQLCGEAHSAADYLELARHFEILIVTDVPAMTLAQRNEARRFITLVDTIYDSKVKLIASMETSIFKLFSSDTVHVHAGAMADSQRLLIDDLGLSTEQITSNIFTGEEEIFAFRRAISRLIEMQSHHWVGEELAAIIKKHWQ
eukprot:jgi/Hompol1/5137/HPOL_000842-RA